MLRYEIIDGEVLITGFMFAHELVYINGIKLNGDFSLINDRFIFSYGLVHNITYIICDDFVCVDCGMMVNFIENYVYGSNLIKRI
jgi:hypothetical protein